MEEEDMSEGMVNGYWVHAWTALAAAKMMARWQKQGKIVLVSSTFSYMSFIDWSTYSPEKHASRVDTLQSELRLYGIDAYIFSPPTMFSTSYEKGDKLKPEIVTDDTMTTRQAALALLNGLKKAQTSQITGDLIKSLCRKSSRDTALKINWIINLIVPVRTPTWRVLVHKKAFAHRQEHNPDLQKSDFFARWLPFLCTPRVPAIEDALRMHSLMFLPY